MGAVPSFLRLRSFLPGELDASHPEKQHGFSVIHESLIPVSHKGAEHCSRGGSRGVGKCTWVFTPSSLWLPRAHLAEVQHAEKRPHLTALLHMYCLCESREPVITEDVSTSPVLNEWVHIILLTQVHSCFWTWILLWELLLHIPYLSFTCPWCSLLASPFESMVLEVLLPTSASIQIPAPCSAVCRVLPILPLPAGGVICPLSSKGSLWKHLGGYQSFFSEGFVTVYLRSI